MTKPEDEMFSAAASEGPLDPKEYAAARTETKSNPVVRLEVAQVQVFEARSHLAGVVEDCPIDGGENLPPILGLQEQHMTVAKAEPPESPEIVRTTERSLQVEGNLATPVRVRSRDQRVKCQHPPVAKQGDVLLQVGFDPAKRVAVGVSVVETFDRESVAASTARVTTRLAIIQVCKNVIAHEVGLRDESRSSRLGEQLADSNAVVRPDQMRRQIIKAAAHGEPWLGTNGSRGTDNRISQTVRDFVLTI